MNTGLLTTLQSNANKEDQGTLGKTRRYSMYGLIDPRDRSTRYIGRTTQALEERLAQHIQQSFDAWHNNPSRHHFAFVLDAHKAQEQLTMRVEQELGIKRTLQCKVKGYEHVWYYTDKNMKKIKAHYKTVYFYDEKALCGRFASKSGWIEYLRSVHTMLPGITLIDTVDTCNERQALECEFRHICCFIQAWTRTHPAYDLTQTFYNKVARCHKLVTLLSTTKESLIEDSVWDVLKDTLIACLDRPLEAIV